MKIPEYGDETEAHPWTTKTKKDYIVRVKEWLHSDHILPLPGYHRIAQRGLTGPLVLQWKNNPKWTSSSPIILGHFLGICHFPLKSCPKETVGKFCMVWPLEIRLWWRRGLGFSPTNVPVLANWVLSYSGAQVETQQDVLPIFRANPVILSG